MVNQVTAGYGKAPVTKGVTDKANRCSTVSRAVFTEQAPYTCHTISSLLGL